jgi:RNA polymerase sigma-70 factor (ECF subfamily)
MPKFIAKQPESHLTEAEAIGHANDGDAAASEYLYKAHNMRAYGVCLRMTKNPAEAEDLTQQTFLQVFRKIETFRGESGFSTWLHRVTANIVLMHLRRKKPAEILFGDLDRPGSDGESRPEYGANDASMLGAIERLNLMRAIRKLPSSYKRFFCTACLDTSTRRSRAAWDVRQAAQNRSFTKRANGCVGYYKENKGRQRSMSRPRGFDT